VYEGHVQQALGTSTHSEHVAPGQHRVVSERSFATPRDRTWWVRHIINPGTASFRSPCWVSSRATHNSEPCLEEAFKVGNVHPVPAPEADVARYSPRVAHDSRQLERRCRREYVLNSDIRVRAWKVHIRVTVGI
jgi:hypothetical protein